MTLVSSTAETHVGTPVETLNVEIAGANLGGDGQDSLAQSQAF
jgi:hypothetical protein